MIPERVADLVRAAIFNVAAGHWALADAWGPDAGAAAASEEMLNALDGVLLSLPTPEHPSAALVDRHPHLARGAVAGAGSRPLSRDEAAALVRASREHVARLDQALFAAASCRGADADELARAITRARDFEEASAATLLAPFPELLAVGRRPS